MRAHHHKASGSSRSALPRRLWWACGLIALAGCQDPQVILPASLKGPVAMTVAQGDVCLRLARISDDGLLGTKIDACQKNPDDKDIRERGAIGLVANSNQDRVAVVALDLAVPSLVDLDLSTPGVNHITVGRRPFDVAASPTGEVAYVINQLDQDLSVLNLWSLTAQPDTLKLPGVPSTLDVHAQKGTVVVGVTAQASSLQLHPGVTCAAPANLPLEVGVADSEEGCEGQAEPWVEAKLDGVLKSVALDPITHTAYVMYANRPWVSVVALDEESRAGEACLDGTQAPCEVARIGATYECSDGLDNDGDGLVDQADTQCFGPLGAESASGVGVRKAGACADGIDNDGDGLTDRLDPACHAASQQDEAVIPAFSVLPECSDGEDNDGDGLLDTADPDCYGPTGATETQVATPVYGTLSVDEHGILGYLTHPLENEVVILDLKGRRVLSAPASASVTDPFADTLGVALSRTVTPTSVKGSIRRQITRDPRNEYENSHGLVTYDLGAYVTGDNGFVYYVDVATISCDVWESDGLLQSEDFYLNPDELALKQESKCLVLPETFATDQVDIAPSCEEFILCRSCQTGSEDDAGRRIEDCALCDRYAALQDDGTTTYDAYAAAEGVCELSERVTNEGLVKRVVNPRFAVRDRATGVDSFQQGSAECIQPEELIDDVNRYIQQNPEVPQINGCGSPFVQQPLSVTVPSRGLSDDLSGVQRVDLLEKRELRLLMSSTGEVSEQLVVDTEDYAISGEAWSIVYEGTLPGARRGDGIVTEQPGVFDVGALNPCESGVSVGDVFVMLSEPSTTNGSVPAGCEEFSTPSPDIENWREYEVLEVGADALTLGVREGLDDVIQTLPRAECFAQGLAYEVRAAESWVVSGSVSGIASGLVERDGVCVPGNGGDAPRVNSRVRGGERYIGPQISFWMTPGVVAPVRDHRYVVNIARNFSASSTPSGLGINTSTPSPTDVLYERLYSITPNANGEWPEFVGRRELIMVVEPSDNVIVVREPLSTEESITIR